MVSISVSQALKAQSQNAKVAAHTAAKSENQVNKPPAEGNLVVYLVVYYYYFLVYCKLMSAN